MTNTKTAWGMVTTMGQIAVVNDEKVCMALLLRISLRPTSLLNDVNNFFYFLFAIPLLKD
jgi:hypothetical protein